MTLLSVVVPVHNEASFLPYAIPALIEAVAAVTSDAEILIMENGSTDGTAALATELGGDKVRVVQLPTPDYGEAMKAGFDLASGEWVVNVDIDYFSADFFRAVVSSDADLVIGSKRDPDPMTVDPSFAVWRRQCSTYCCASSSEATSRTPMG
jgi:glycosyltransferase involved in cell wall biosynthesis